MTQREQKLLRYFLLILAVYLVPFELIPHYQAFHEQLMEKNRSLAVRIAQLERLQSQETIWRARSADLVQKKQKLERSLFSGSTREIIGARLQGTVRKATSLSRVKLTSLDLPEFLETGPWLITTQIVHFEAPTNALLQFLDLLKQDRHHTLLTGIDARSNKGVLRGTLRITGFSKAPQS